MSIKIIINMVMSIMTIMDGHGHGGHGHGHGHGMIMNMMKIAKNALQQRDMTPMAYLVLSTPNDARSITRD